MQPHINAYNQPVGHPLPDWTPRQLPVSSPLSGQYCVLEQVIPARHGDALYAAYERTGDDRDWTYLSVGPFNERAAFDQYLDKLHTSTDPLHFAVIDRASGKAVGTIALMRIDVSNGVIEIGFVVYSAALKQSRIATEAQFLLMQYAFDSLGYRRYEWKCDSLNAPSRAAAMRLGFTFEGIFRNAIVYKGRTRDTAWFSITDTDWKKLKPAYTAWLSPGNFDAAGVQQTRLSTLTQTALTT